VTPDALNENSVLECRDLIVKYGSRTVLDVSSISVKDHQVLGLIGPNGSGKTTLLLCLALLLKPSSGHVLYRGVPVTADRTLTAMRRRFAVAFQEPLLLNGTVWENVTLGLKLRGIRNPERSRRAQFWLERFGIAGLARQTARTLSGGEAQRANLARAFALQPEVLFLDEPFAAVDAPTRQSLFGDMYNILQETRCTTVMVTHDRNEAQTLSQHIVMLVKGRIIQDGTPRDIFSAPASSEVANFVGMENIIPGTVISIHDCLAEVKVEHQIIEGVSTCLPSVPVNIFIRPEDITLSLKSFSSSARNTFGSRITAMVPNGPLVRVSLDCGFPLFALITRLSADEMQLRVGLNLYASFKATAIHILPR
jgi:tungstate transport system ATP-binding protein